MGFSHSKVEAVQFPEDFIEQLRCSSCKGYLSCAPVRLLGDGSSICGRCPPPNEGTPVYRELMFERILSTVKFPCPFKVYGCDANMQFGSTIDHEITCAFQPFACPAASLGCSWQGSVVQVRQHFYRLHPSFLSAMPKLQLEVKKDKESVLLVISTIPFVIKYQYSAQGASLSYIVKYFSCKTVATTCRIKLINTFVPDNNVNLVGNKCLPYNSDPSEKATELNVSKFLDILGNPTHLTVEFDLPSIPIDNRLEKALSHINHELLDSLRCTECQSYLAPPVFIGARGSVCCSCAANDSLLLDESLTHLVMEANYPCRWKGCSRVVKAHSFREHEKVCAHQPQKCLSSRCNTVLTVAEHFAMSAHLILIHGYYLFTRKTVYSTTFKLKNIHVAVTVTNSNEIVAVKHKLDRFGATGETHTFSLRSSRGSSTDVVACVHFKHSHCKMMSKRFLVRYGNDIIVLSEMLPQCFRSEGLMSVVVEVQ